MTQVSAGDGQNSPSSPTTSLTNSTVSDIKPYSSTARWPNSAADP
jgi:hypothetical protein